MLIYTILILTGSAIVGLALGFLIYKQKINAIYKEAKKQSETIKQDALKNAEVLKKETAVKAKEDWFDRKKELDKEITSRKKKLRGLENQYNQRIDNLENRLSKIASREQSINDRETNIAHLKINLQKKEVSLKDLIEQETIKLHEIAQLNKEEAIKKLFEKYENEAKLDAANLRKEIIDKSKSEAEEKATRILATAIQRYSVEHVAESCISVVPLPSDEMKGRIIGREGRNIRTFENLTGIEIIVDDTPEAVVLSGFHPIRREIARRSLEFLIQDGRIHPGRIEEVIAKMRDKIDKIIIETGKQTCLDLSLLDIPKSIQKLIGTLKFRTSYGQNVLQHSIETSWICGMLAAELGLDQSLARKIGLLHDIGKAVDFETEGSHPEIGAQIAKRNGLSDLIINAIEAHHEDVEAKSAYAILVQAADAISGSRPGARRETLETYMKRLEELENIANSFDGVYNCYAIQAGREIRLMVKHQQINDAQAEMLASDVAKKIEENLQYPGQIKVTVIREFRKTAQAK
ncbi:MAG: ribonuclease Y [Candidatus Cloacimonadota bacterium]|nr:ribonuclease Y [Candidatus Cloacimonadota bacterium]